MNEDLGCRVADEVSTALGSGVFVRYGDSGDPEKCHIG